MQWHSPGLNRTSHHLLSGGYPGDERKQIPLFRITGTVLRFPSTGTGSGSLNFQLNGGIQ